MRELISVDSQDSDAGDPVRVGRDTIVQGITVHCSEGCYSAGLVRSSSHSTKIMIVKLR